MISGPCSRWSRTRITLAKWWQQNFLFHFQHRPRPIIERNNNNDLAYYLRDITQVSAYDALQIRLVHTLSCSLPTHCWTDAFMHKRLNDSQPTLLLVNCCPLPVRYLSYAHMTQPVRLTAMNLILNCCAIEFLGASLCKHSDYLSAHWHSTWGAMDLVSESDLPEQQLERKLDPFSNQFNCSYPVDYSTPKSFALRF